MDLKVQMWCCTDSGFSYCSDLLSCLHQISNLHILPTEMLIQCHISTPVIYHNKVSSSRIVRYRCHLSCCSSNHLCTHRCPDIDTLMIRRRSLFRWRTVSKVGSDVVTGRTGPKENALTGVHRALRPEIHFKLLHIIIKELVPFSKRRGLGHPQKQSPVLSVPEMYMEALLAIFIPKNWRSNLEQENCGNALFL